MTRTAAHRRDIGTEADLWSKHVEMLQRALRMRKPDARDRIRSEAARLEREIEALSARRNLAAMATRRTGIDLAREPAFAQLDEQVAQRMRQVSDLLGLLRHPVAPGRAQDEGATPETAARPAAIDPIAMLQGKGRLSEDQARAAREIAWVYQAMTKAGRARVSRLSQIDPPTGWRDVPMPERAAFLHAKRFRPWAEKLRRSAPATLDIVFRIAVLGLSVYGVARGHRMSWGRCLARLAEGLDLYWRKDSKG